MSSAEPIVSIITVCYNSAGTIVTTLESVAAQSYPHLEHIIVDGLSGDQTLDIVKRFPHVKKVISEKDQGIYDAMNKGVQAATGAIIGILNSDDFYTGPEVIREVVQQITATGSQALYADLVYVSSRNIERIVRTWKAGSYQERKFLFGWMPPHPTFFVRREVYAMYGSFRQEMKSAADYELMLRFLYKNNIPVTYLPKTIVKMRTGGQSNASLRNRWLANREDRYAWQVNGLRPYFFTLWLKPLRKVFQFL